MSLISLKNVSRLFSGRKVLDGVTFDFPSKGLFGIVGASGSGKSTLLNIIGGLDNSYSGLCSVGGCRLKEMDEEARSAFRLKHIGYVFQNFNLLELDSVLDNVLFPLSAVSSVSFRLQKRKAVELLSFVGLENKQSQRANTLSGGEKQRVAFARALSCDPAILLCDEPTGSLDGKSAAEVFSIMKRISEKCLVIVVSHDAFMVGSTADAVLTVCDGRIIGCHKSDDFKASGSFLSLSVSPPKERPCLGVSFLLRHSFNILRAKKWRTILTEGFISAGLVGLGLALFVSSSISSKMSKAFSSIMNPSEVVMSRANDASPSIGNVYAVGEEQAHSIVDRYPSLINDYGVSYLVNFEEFFIDGNRVFIQNGNRPIELPAFSIRSVNDYVWLDEHSDLTCFPERPISLEDDQVVVGLPFSAMFNLCYGLQILRNYEALGDYIEKESMNMIFQLENSNWSYCDEQIVNVRAVVASSEPTLFHFNHRWSSYVFETKMRFPTSDGSASSLPWIMNKVFFLVPSKSKTDFLKAAKKDGSLASYVFERPASEYDSTHCPIGEVCALNRLYLYLADKFSIPYEDIDSVAAQKGFFSSYFLCPRGSYVVYPGSLMEGFSHKLFVSDRKSEIEQLIDASSLQDERLVGDDFSLPPNSLEGGYLKTANGGVSFSSDLSHLISGRRLIGNDEIVISRRLSRLWNSPDDFYLTASIGENIHDGKVERDFRIAQLKVVGIVDEEKAVIYHESSWTVDFFRDALGMSSFFLEPTDAIFTLKDPASSEQVISRLSRDFPAYRFVNPSKAVMLSVASTISYVELMLRLFSAVSLAISILLFIVVSVIAMAENKREIYLLYSLGVSRRDIAESFICLSFLQIAGAVIGSCFSLIAVEAAVDAYICSTFGLAFSFSPDFGSLASVMTFAVMFVFLMALATKAIIWRKNLEPS